MAPRIFAVLIVSAALASGCESDRPAEPAAAGALHAVGVVQAVDAEAGTITIAHEPMEALGWPAMTMPFKIARPELLDGVAVGAHVEFTLERADMTAPITALRTTH